MVFLYHWGSHLGLGCHLSKCLKLAIMTLQFILPVNMAAATTLAAIDLIHTTNIYLVRLAALLEKTLACWKQVTFLLVSFNCKKKCLILALRSSDAPLCMHKGIQYTQTDDLTMTSLRLREGISKTRGRTRYLFSVAYIDGKRNAAAHGG